MSDVRDRSSIQLNMDSQIMVQLTDEARPVKLINGWVWKLRSRPCCILLRASSCPVIFE